MISEVGSYSDLIKTKGDFAEFISQHTEDGEMEANEEIESKTKSRSSSLRNSFGSSKSVCFTCKNRQPNCTKCNRQRTDSISSKISYKSELARPISKTFEDFDLENDLNKDDETSFAKNEIEEPDQNKLKNSKLTETEKIKAGAISIKTYLGYLNQFNTLAFIMVVFFYFIAYTFNYWSFIWLGQVKVS